MKSTTIVIIGLCLCIVLLNVEARKSRARGRGNGRSYNSRSSQKSSEDFTESEDSDEGYVSGEEMRECKCPDKLKPVCANDGRTYKDKCVFECYKKKDSSLKIKKDKSYCRNSDSIEESGSKEKRNKGLLGLNTDIKTKSRQHGCDCSERYRPVCASDKRTYDNECLMKCKSKHDNVRIKYSGPCDDRRLIGSGDGIAGTGAGRGLLNK